MDSGVLDLVAIPVLVLANGFFVDELLATPTLRRAARELKQANLHMLALVPYKAKVAVTASSQR